MSDQEQMISDLNKVFEGFKIKATCIGARKHRHFSFYDIVLNYNCRINKILQYNREIALAMKVKTNFIVKIIPERGIVRLQTSHETSKTLDFNDFYSSAITKKPESYFLPFLLGETDEATPLWIDVSKCPHLLIAGSTGSGKSVLLHTLIKNILLSKDDLYLVDTKKVEFSVYSRDNFKNKNITCIFDYDSALGLLEYLSLLMESRYSYFSECNKSDIKEAPYLNNIILIIDEIADLMLQQTNKEFEKALVRLAQKGRAAGIHIILATQRPSADVLTGLIKANFPSRIACKVASKVDSRVILDSSGAENLNGCGEAIIKCPTHDFIRFQVAYTDPQKYEKYSYKN